MIPVLVRAAVGGDGGGGVCEHHLNESTRNDEPETMQRERKKSVHQQRASHSKSKLRQSHYIFLLYNNSLMWQLLFIFFLCVCALCSVLSGLRQPVLRIFVVHYRRRCAIFVCLHIFCSQSVWIVSLRLLDLYHVQTFLACSTLSRSIEAKQTFWPVCAWSTVVIVVAISPSQQLQLNVVTETERYVCCHVWVFVCVCVR